MREEVEEELELCEAVFAEELSVRRCDDAQGEARAALALELRPNTCEDESQLFVKLTLGLTLGAGYPEEPPAMAVPQSKGLDDAQLAALLAALQETAAEDPGEPVILALVERAKDFLDEHNVAPSECSICLEPLPVVAGAGQGEPEQQLLRLDCFHCFHAACAARWRLSVLATAEAKRAANPHAAGANKPPDWVCTVCRAPLGERARATVEAAIELETREERLESEHSVTVAAYESVLEDGSDKQIAAAAKEMRRTELALEGERERLRQLAEREAAFARELQATTEWKTAEVEAAAAERRRRYEEAQERGGLIDATWLRRVAAAGTIEGAEVIEAVAAADAAEAEEQQQEEAKAKAKAAAAKAKAAKAQAAKDARAKARAEARAVAKRTTAAAAAATRVPASANSRGRPASAPPAATAAAAAGAGTDAGGGGSDNKADAGAAAAAALAKAKAGRRGGGGGGRGNNKGRAGRGGVEGSGGGGGDGNRARGRGRGRGRGSRGKANGGGGPPG
jgi:regulator of extracellular matrix RemA (YlzA/DUF370 family)